MILNGERVAEFAGTLEAKVDLLKMYLDTNEELYGVGGLSVSSLVDMKDKAKEIVQMIDEALANRTLEFSNELDRRVRL